MSAPCSINSKARFKYSCGVLYKPPSENESGVILRIPIIKGVCICADFRDMKINYGIKQVCHKTNTGNQNKKRVFAMKPKYSLL
jgi:hypothetical protein